MWKGWHLASLFHCRGLSWLTECLTGTFWLTDRDARTMPSKPGLSRLKRAVWYAYLKEMSILPLQGKNNGKIVSTKLLPLMYCKKLGYFLGIRVIYLEKYLRIKGNFCLCTNQVRYCMYLPATKNILPLCKNPTKGNCRVFGVVLLVAQRYVG